MTFLAPAALWFAAVGLGIVALYILKIRRQRQTVPSLEFWRQLLVESQVRSLFQRLKRWLSLLLWLVIAACFVFALGNPVITAGRMKPETLVVILDNSASMQTVDEDADGKMRFERAVGRIKELIEGRPVQDRLMLIEAGAQPRVVCGFHQNRRAFLAALADLKPRDEPGRLMDAVEMAGRFIEGQDDARLIVVSDGADSTAKQLQSGATSPNGVPNSPPKENRSLLHWKIGGTADNLGITRLNIRVHRQLAEHHGLIRVVNSSTSRVETQIVFEIDGSPTRVEPLAVDAGQTWEKTVTLQQPDGGVLRAFIDRKDALGIDNEAFAILEPIERATVFLVSPAESSYFFRQVLLAMDSLVDRESSRVLTPEEYERLGPLAAESDLTIFNNCVPKEWDKARRVVFVDQFPESLPLREIEPLPATRIFVAEDQHPLMRFVSFAGVGVAKGRRVELTEPATVLAKSPAGDPMIFAIRKPNLQSLCLTFNLLDSDLPVRNSFPILMRNAVTFFGTEQDRWLRSQYHVGELVELLRPLPADTSTMQVETLEDGKTRSDFVPGNQNLAARLTQQIGPVKLTIGDEVAYAAVNLCDTAESSAGIAIGTSPDGELVHSSQWLGMLPWQALALAGLVLVCLEWFTYHARWTE